MRGQGKIGRGTTFISGRLIPSPGKIMNAAWEVSMAAAAVGRIGVKACSTAASQ